MSFILSASLSDVHLDLCKWYVALDRTVTSFLRTLASLLHSHLLLDAYLICCLCGTMTHSFPPSDFTKSFCSVSQGALEPVSVSVGESSSGLAEEI